MIDGVSSQDQPDQAQQPKYPQQYQKQAPQQKTKKPLTIVLVIIIIAIIIIAALFLLLGEEGKEKKGEPSLSNVYITPEEPMSQDEVFLHYTINNARNYCVNITYNYSSVCMGSFYSSISISIWTSGEDTYSLGRYVAGVRVYYKIQLENNNEEVIVEEPQRSFVIGSTGPTSISNVYITPTQPTSQDTVILHFTLNNMGDYNIYIIYDFSSPTQGDGHRSIMVDLELEGEETYELGEFETGTEVMYWIEIWDENNEEITSTEKHSFTVE